MRAGGRRAEANSRRCSYRPGSDGRSRSHIGRSDRGLSVAAAPMRWKGKSGLWETRNWVPGRRSHRWTRTFRSPSAHSDRPERRTHPGIASPPKLGPWSRAKEKQSQLQTAPSSSCPSSARGLNAFSAKAVPTARNSEIAPIQDKPCKPIVKKSRLFSRKIISPRMEAPNPRAKGMCAS